MNTIVLVEVAQALSLDDLIWKYKQVMSNADIDTVKKFRITRVKKF